MNNKNKPIRVLLADDHTLFREGVAEIFAATDGIQVVGEAEDGQETIALAQKENPDVILLDVEMPLMGAEEALGQIRRTSPSSKVLILTMYDEPQLVRKLLALGAHAYLVKMVSREELISAVRALSRAENRVILSVSRETTERLQGQSENVLTARELEVLLLAARAMSNSQIARFLHISEGTVKRHLTNIFAKLGVCSRADAAKKALCSGLITFREFSQ